MDDPPVAVTSPLPAEEAPATAPSPTQFEQPEGHARPRFCCARHAADLDATVQPEEALYRWPMSRITWKQAVQLTAVSPQDVTQTYQAAWHRWALACGIEPVELESDQVVNCAAYSADGPLQGFDSDTTLALTQLPAGASAETQLWQRINDHEEWTAPFLYLVLLHEIGHWLGLEHSSDPADIMYPYYQVTDSDLSPADVQQGQLRYGPSLIPADSPARAAAPGPFRIVSATDDTIVFEYDAQKAGEQAQFNLVIPFTNAGIYHVTVMFKKDPTP